MKDDEFTYVVRCHTCHTKFKVQLFESHEKNLFLVDKRDWYCDKCKTAYFSKQTETLSKTHQDMGLPALTGTAKMISWAEKIRAELINKVNYLQKSLSFDRTEYEPERNGICFTPWARYPRRPQGAHRT